jgi:hypothetical protein
MARRSGSPRRRSTNRKLGPASALVLVLAAAGIAGAAFGQGAAPAPEPGRRSVFDHVEAPPPALLDATASFWARPDLPGDPIDVHFSSLDLAQAVRFLTGERTNVLAASSVARPVSMELRAVPTAVALDWLLRTEGIAARFEGNTVYLTGQERRTYRLPLVVGEESPVWGEIESGLERALSQSEGVLVLNRAAGVLTVEDTPANLDRIEAHLNQSLASVLRQVEIEVKILEVVYDENRGMGIDWTVMNGVLDPDWTFTGGTPRGHVASQTVTDQREIFQLGVLKPGKLQIFLDAFEEDIELNLISRPRITMMSNQPAMFEVKERIPYLTKTTSQEGGVPITEFELQFDEAGIDLRVVASVGDDGVITMDVHPTVSTVVGFTQSLPDLGPQPIIDTRETRSVVRLRERHSLVMGGLMQDRENVTINGVPVLSRVPLLGRFFRSEQVRVEKTEILIVLTPRVRRETAARSLAESDRIRPSRFVPADAGVPAGLAATRGERAWVRLMAGDPAGALGPAASAARVEPAAWWTLNNLGLAYREVGWLARAEASLRKAVLATEPPPAEALVNLGVLLLHRGEADEAAALLEEAASRAAYGPVRDEALLAWALALEQADRPGEAMRVLDAAGGVEGRLGDRIEPRVTRLLGRMQQASAAPTPPAPGARP